MALAFDEVKLSPTTEPEMAEHVRTYRAFTFYVKLAIVAVPLLVAFVLYWMR